MSLPSGESSVEKLPSFLSAAALLGQYVLVDMAVPLGVVRRGSFWMESGRCFRRRERSGRMLGRQALTTPMLGSTAVQTIAST